MTTQAQHAEIDTLRRTLAMRDESLKAAQLLIDKLKIELSYLKRMRYGRSSEQLEHDAQLELMSAGMAPVPAADNTAASNVIPIEQGHKKRKDKIRPVCASCQHACRATPWCIALRVAAAAPRAVPVCARSVRTSLKCWSMSPATFASRATFAPSWRAALATALCRHLRPAARLIAAWLALACWPTCW